MIDQGLVERITRLPARERLALIEVLTRSLREELPEVEHAPQPQVGSDLVEIKRLAHTLNLDLPPASSLHQLLGVTSTGAVSDAKEELRELIADYLIEKHS